MRTALVLIAIGWLALIVQGALATLIPPPICPDLGLLVVIAIGLRWEGLTSGLCMVGVLGYVADLLSGSLLGQHALLRVFTFLGARLANRQLNLKGSVPQAIFTAGASLAHGLGLLLLSSFFVESVELRWSWLGGALVHAPMNALLAPLAVAFVERVSVWLSEEDGGRRLLRLDAGRRVA